MEMVTAGRPDPQNFSSFLYVKVDHAPPGLDVLCTVLFSEWAFTQCSFSALLQLSFLDFFEILLGCAEVKRLSSTELKELESSEDTYLTGSRSPLVRLSLTPHDVASCYLVPFVALLLKVDPAPCDTSGKQTPLTVYQTACLVS